MKIDPIGRSFIPPAIEEVQARRLAALRQRLDAAAAVPAAPPEAAGFMAQGIRQSAGQGGGSGSSGDVPRRRPPQVKVEPIRNTSSPGLDILV